MLQFFISHVKKENENKIKYFKQETKRVKIWEVTKRMNIFYALKFKVTKIKFKNSERTNVNVNLFVNSVR